MDGFESTATMSSTRPPMLAGPIARKTNRLSTGSVDQLTGVGVGLGLGVAGRCAAGAAPWGAPWPCEYTVTVARLIATTITNSIPASRTERGLSFIGKFLSTEMIPKTTRDKTSALEKASERCYSTRSEFLAG